MSRQTHPWGVPPWSVDFRPAPGPLPDRVDFAIVGGGFTGLCAAAWLARLAPKKSVLVLEASALGEGASGRTGGLALEDTAAGPLPGLGDVLAGYQKILRTFASTPAWNSQVCTSWDARIPRRIRRSAGAIPGT